MTLSTTPQFIRTVLDAGPAAVMQPEALVVG
jgi:hypothetical protein